jgi:hypothetical protein
VAEDQCVHRIEVDLYDRVLRSLNLHPAACHEWPRTKEPLAAELAGDLSAHHPQEGPFQGVLHPTIVAQPGGSGSDGSEVGFVS